MAPPHQASAWAAAAIVVAGAGVLYSSRSRFAPEIPTNAKQFTSYPGQPSGPVFSPDGKEVAFIWNGPNRDNFDIYVKAVDGAEPRRLTTNSARDLDPAWSRDGRYIAFRREIGAHCGIFVIPAGGGPERKVAETVVPFASGTPMRDAMSGMSWSADGDHLLVVDTGKPGDGPNAIVSRIHCDRRKTNSHLASARNVRHVPYIRRRWPQFRVLQGPGSDGAGEHLCAGPGLADGPAGPTPPGV